MNVLFVNTKIFWGGGEKLHFEYAEKFIELGHNVTIACPQKSPLFKKSKKKGIDTFDIFLGNFAFLNPFKINRLVCFLKDKNIEIIIISNSPDLKASSFAAKIAGVKKVVYLRGLAIPIKNNFINRYIFKKVLSHIVPNSEETRRTTLKHFKNVILTCKIKVIYHGIDIKKFDDNLKFADNNKKDYIILGNAGRLTEQKGQKYLVDVAELLKKRKVKFKLLIAGSGNLKREIEKDILNKNLQNEIELLGFVENVENFMSKIDVFLLSSVWEGFGYVIVEAMAAKKPVIAFDMSSNPEIIENNKTGFLIDFPDINSFVTIIEELINNKELRKKIGLAGRERLEKLFVLDDRIKEFEEFITK